MRHELYMIDEGCEEVARERGSRVSVLSSWNPPVARVHGITVNAGGMESLSKSTLTGPRCLKGK